MKTKKNSRIISFVLSTLLILSLSTVTSYSRLFAASGSPELLITEVMPMSQNGDDAYEYIELYNNTDNTIDLKGYKLPYQNIDITNSKLIPAKSVLVICTRSSTSLANFNTFYGTNLTDGKYMTLPLTNEVLSNSTAQSILLAKDDGTVIIRANYTNGNFETKRSVTYQYPQTGFDMRILGQHQYPTPGSVTADQIPYTGIKVTGITLDKSFMTMETDQTAVLHATISPVTASNKEITWASSDTRIVSVSSSGVITAKSQGIAVISAKTMDGGYTSTCVVQVQRIPVKGVSLDKTNITLDVAKTIVLTAAVNPVNATNKSLIWSSSNSNIASVDSNGLVKGKSQGIAVITVKTADGGFTASCTAAVKPVNVTIPVTGIRLNKSVIVVKQGQSEKLIAIVFPSNAADKSIVWSSNNAKFAAVSPDGKVTGINKGIAIITATTKDGKYSVKCIVVIKDKNDKPKGNPKH